MHPINFLFYEDIILEIDILNMLTFLSVFHLIINYLICF